MAQMQNNKKRSFFERLTGGVRLDEEEEVNLKGVKKGAKEEWTEEENEEAELTVDVYQTASDIIVQSMVAGVRPDDLELIVSRDMLTIKGKREETRTIEEDNYFVKELYWGKFSRTISLPQEVEPEEVEATEKHGLLTVKIKKVDKDKKSNIRIRSI
jgi:HSP20 family protein